MQGVTAMARAFKRRVHSRLMRVRKRQVLADGEAHADWYDDAYRSAPAYRQHWSESHYLPVWEAIEQRIPRGAAVLEVGCGPGQLAQMLRDHGVLSGYVGFDFSAVAVEMARTSSTDLRFEEADAYTTGLFADVAYDTVICTEVLEHLADDLGILERVPAGVHVLATVPDFDYDSHVRFFADEDAVRARYGHLFAELDVSRHFHTGDVEGHNGVFFLLDGRRGSG
jgi:SAM-dependent methyltransferase